MSFEGEIINVTIEDLKPSSKHVRLFAKVIEKSEPREVVSRDSGETNTVADILIGNDTGTVILTAWNADIDRLEIGKIYEFSNVYCTLYRNHLRLNLGRYGTYTETDEMDFEPNLENNKSDKEYEDYRYNRPRRHYRSSQYRNIY